VLIVGGGGAGLTASALLARYGVETLLVNDRAETSRLPKAHMLNQRTMEILAEAGVADAVYEHGTPAANMRATGWYAGLGPPGAPDRGRTIGRIEAWGAGYEDPDYVLASPCRSANLPQIRLEPLLRARAELAAPGRVRFNHELVALDQDATAVRAEIVDRASGEPYTVTADYAIGADGGRTVGGLLGIELEGEPPSRQMVTIFMSADLAGWVHEDDVVSYHLVNPDVGSTLENGTLLSAGPRRWGRHSEQWYFHLMYDVGDEAAFDDADVVRRMRTVIGIGDFDCEIHAMSRWQIYGALATRFRAGRVFLAGDAAHRNPPMGGLGLNSAIGDVHNLCWKLAAALRGELADAALDSYEQERRPLCDAVIRRAIANSHRAEGLHAALGISPDADRDANWAALREIWADGERAEAKRQAVRAILGRHTMDYRDLNVEVGLAYGESAMLASEAGEPRPAIDPIRVYEPTTRPGSPLPHAFVEDGHRRVSLRELCGGRWLLVCGEHAGRWRAAALELARERRLALDAITVGHAEGDWFDVRCAWLRQREIEPGGCVLARPDRFVAWRTIDGAGDPRAQLAQLLDRLGLR